MIDREGTRRRAGVGTGLKQLSVNTCHRGKKGTVRLTARVFTAAEGAASSSCHSQTGSFDIICIQASACQLSQLLAAFGCLKYSGLHLSALSPPLIIIQCQIKPAAFYT